MNSLFNNVRLNINKLYSTVNITELVRFKTSKSYCLKTKSAAVKRFSLNKSNGKVKFHPRANPDTTAYVNSKLYTNTFKSSLFSCHPNRKSKFFTKYDNPQLTETIIQ